MNRFWVWLLLSVGCVLTSCAGPQPKLPQGAKNISRYSSHNMTSLTFSISEDAFLTWADGLGFPKAKLTSIASSSDKTSFFIREDNTPLDLVVIRNGFHGWEATNTKGGSVLVAFDRDAGKAFYVQRSR